MPEQVQQLAVESERSDRARLKRPGAAREDVETQAPSQDRHAEAEDQETTRAVRITADDIAKERWRQKARDEELLDTLHHLSEHSLTTTRRLDDTYYTILERVSHLRSTINSLQELSSRTKSLCRQFENDSEEISKDIAAQTRHFDNFNDQRRKIAELETRIRAGQERSVQVGETLEKCRERLACVEKRDAEEVKRNTRFYRGVWSTLGIIGGVLLLLLIGHLLRTPSKHVRGVPGNVEKVGHALNRSSGQLPPQVLAVMEELKRDRESGGRRLEDHSNGHENDEKLAKRFSVFDEL